MGLDIYVGSLTRYIAGDWELKTQKIAREMGLKMNVIRKNEDKEDAIRDPEMIRPVVLAWQRGISDALGQHLKKPLDWDESLATPYFTDKPAWDCYADLLIWAAYDEQPTLSRPEGNVEKWTEDPAYIASTSKEFRSRYSHLFEVVLWLPCPFEIVFSTNDVVGNPVMIGSSVALLRQMEDLNRRTWGADDETVNKWALNNSAHGAPLESGAKFALALILMLARKSVEHRLPMRLDW